MIRQRFEIERDGIIRGGWFQYDCVVENAFEHRVRWSGEVEIRVGFMSKSFDKSGEMVVPIAAFDRRHYDEPDETMEIGNLILRCNGAAENRSNISFAVSGANVRGTGVLDTSEPLVKILWASAEVAVYGMVANLKLRVV